MNISKPRSRTRNTYLPFAAIRSFFSSGLLAEALSRLDEREREMIYLSFFKRIPQHEIGRQYGRSRSTAGYHIRKVLRQLQAEMEGMAYEK